MTRHTSSRAAAASVRPIAAPNVATALAAARSAQTTWADTPLPKRLATLRGLRRLIAADPMPWAEELAAGGLRTVAEGLATEVIPLLDACRFAQRVAPALLREQRLSTAGRPFWCRGVSVRVRREPLGVVLLIGPGNYPLFLLGVQVVHAIAAGNAVLVKPPPGGEAPALRLVASLREAGVHPCVVQLLDADPSSAQQAIELGVDKIVLTGGVKTGRRVLHGAAETLTPTTMELSGCDAAWVLGSADLERAARCLAFGLTLNSGATCIAPRRVYVDERHADALCDKLLRQLAGAEACIVPEANRAEAHRLIGQALDAGATLLSPKTGYDPSRGAFPPVVLRVDRGPVELQRSDLFAPVMTVAPVVSEQELLAETRRCPYGLGVSIFGDEHDALRLARQAPAGCVTINDIIAPTADPRVPFSGWGQSGFGVTRGSAGLLEMTRLKAVVARRGAWLPHLDPPRPGLAKLLAGFLTYSHAGTMAGRWRGLRDVAGALREKPSSTDEP
ncbi:Aldehyde dehydrogenase [Pirellulimonas nuda]|uniref:Aldehyde dehydrogenase n=1 Tax=Pirellulimonas nuda TaxID=2528009 RepID=A0A518DGL8_9BACT|nr:aldehyde dehydrogenase family protein [Pirellulimonas nuda]QDU90615.1 Aldehyde dehydrogenase [Pirellulimonas nuda]